ncbi:pirin family protein [Pseudoduganella sp. UC29_106]|uniref:pirin family protein n=1 Tax=Pseudoduganella sp. UC29_106 TaxID=3374553 RepID=UPI0037564C4D
MNIAQIIKGHERDLGGGFVVRRFLPAAIKQAVGPFIFFDHFGPIDVAPDADHDVRPHPHIGLATVTYLFEGAMEHRDSLGTLQRIEPGAINWMTAGRGIVHSERTPKDLKGTPHRTHGLQLWAALPKAHEEDEPGFCHTGAEEIPSKTIEGAEVRVMIGTAFGMTSPVQTYSETLYIDVKLRAGQGLALTGLPQEAAIYPVSGTIEIDGAPVALQTMALLDTATSQRVQATSDAQFVIIGGEPLDGHRYLFWNFVSSSKERLKQAADDWEAQRFPKVPHETEFIPLPKKPSGL